MSKFWGNGVPKSAIATACKMVRDGTGYPSGTLKSESWYRENTLRGLSREYSEDQVKVLEDVYEYGILNRQPGGMTPVRETKRWAMDPAGPSFARLQRYRAEKRWLAVAG
jgi:hypothetical protein